MRLFEDRAAIEELLTHFQQALDDREWELIGECLTQEFEYVQPVAGGLDAGGPVGTDAFIDMARQVATRVAAVQHYLANVAIQIRGDDARATASAFVVHVFTRDGRSEIVHSGARLEHLFRRTLDGWRVARLTATPTWRDDRFPGLLQGTLAPGRFDEPRSEPSPP